MFKKLDEFLDSILDMGIPGYDTVIYKDGKRIYRRTRGYFGKERFNIYSCSKPITAVAALQLWEKGLYGLSDKLSDYMPEFADMMVKNADGTLTPAKNPITIEHLFTMTAGFSYEVGTPELIRGYNETNGLCPTREMMKYLAREPLLFEPGTAWNYSYCHDVLAAFVEVISGVRFAEYVRMNIFEPLGMKDSTFNLPESELDTLCTQYNFTGIPRKAKEISKNVYMYKFGPLYEAGGASAVSTVDDMIKFLEALRVGDVILKSDTIDFMCIDRLTEQTRTNYWYPNYGYGLGVRCPKEPFSTDFGWSGAAGSYMIVDRVNGITAYHAQHTLNSPNSAERRALAGIITECIMGKSTEKADARESENMLEKYQ